jgi:hypothetical protein
MSRNRLHFLWYICCTPIVFAIVFASDSSACAATTPRDLQSDTWVATDALGRSLGLPDRPPRTGRFVGVFYFMVHGTVAKHDTATPPYDVASDILDNSVILKQLRGDLGPNNPAYLNAYHTPGNYWWGEPAVGYFLSDDQWVHRRNLRMLANAGVDVIFLDATNAVLYEDAQRALFQAADDLMREGIAVPKIGYVLHAKMAETAQRVYDQFYANNRYRDLWFYWLGKPLLMASADAVTIKDQQPIADSVRRFFTWRESWAWTAPARPPKKSWFGDGHDKWPWLDDFPQGFGWHDARDRPEEVPVSIAGHPTTDLGRSFHGAPQHGGSEPPLNAEQLSPDTPRGLYFAEQWQRAIELDPQFIFVTGWNEWYARRFPQPPPYIQPVGDHHLPYFFVDEYNPEFSRDAMPMKGGFGDNYYLQLVEGIRRFKGARPAPIAKAMRTIAIEGGFDQWANVGPEYLNAAGDTAGRDWPGWGEEHYHVPAKRNDIALAKVACDSQTIAFYVRTAAPLSAPDGKAWMQLLIDLDQNPDTGWHGYDFLINRTQPTAGIASIERWVNGGWKSAGTAAMKAVGNELMIVVPRRAISLPAGHGTAIDFHWLDDVPLPADPADFWYRGESAPDGRFNYRYMNSADGQPASTPSRPTPISRSLSAAK